MCKFGGQNITTTHYSNEIAVIIIFSFHTSITHTPLLVDNGLWPDEAFTHRISNIKQ